MELCPGGDLFDRVRSRFYYSEPPAAKVMRSLVQVVSHCHTLGICHRDLKPENVLLLRKDCDTTLKLIDFGIAGILKEGGWMVAWL